MNNISPFKREMQRDPLVIEVAHAVWKYRTDKAVQKFGKVAVPTTDLTETAPHVRDSVYAEAEIAVRTILGRKEAP